MKIGKTIGIIVAILFIIYLAYAVTLGIISDSRCKNNCKERGTEFYELMRNGNMDLKDLCVCYFPENKFESFMLG